MLYMSKSHKYLKIFHAVGWIPKDIGWDGFYRSDIKRLFTVKLCIWLNSHDTTWEDADFNTVLVLLTVSF